MPGRDDTNEHFIEPERSKQTHVSVLKWRLLTYLLKEYHDESYYRSHS
jgi:hypothetical protein